MWGRHIHCVYAPGGSKTAENKRDSYQQLGSCSPHLDLGIGVERPEFDLGATQVVQELLSMRLKLEQPRELVRRDRLSL